jgi:hypothetical protein
MQIQMEIYKSEICILRMQLQILQVTIRMVN